MKIAAIQMNSSDDSNANLEKTKSLVSEAQSEGAKICFLPENFAFMGHPRELLNSVMEDKDSGPIQDAISQLARDEKVWIIAGSIPIKDLETGKSLSRSITFNDVGDVVGYYDKIHLFDVEVSEEEAYRESSYIASGEDLVTTTVEEMMFGLTICYDMRFPELYRALSQRGAEIFSIPSAFTVPTGRAHWHTLLRARAIENLAWVIAPAQVGRHPHGRETYGHSLIVGPWGELIGERSDSPGVVLATINRDAAKQKRARFPSLTHRRL